MSDIPLHCHSVVLAGLVFRIDGEVRKEIERYLKGQPQTPFITVDTLAGEELTVTADAVNSCVIFSYTPETRAWERAFQKVVDLECPVSDR